MLAGKGHSALDKIRERDAAGARGSTPPRGPLSWLFPGRGLLLGLSDMLLDILLLKPQVRSRQQSWELLLRSSTSTPCSLSLCIRPC